METKNTTYNIGSSKEGSKSGKWGFTNTLQMIRYNLKIIFGNRFIYFLLAAVALTFFIIGVNLFNGDAVSEAGVYRILTLAGALLLFYPTAFGIQSDKDARTLEIIFGIPDYRYRVWLMRLLLIYVITTLLLFTISAMLRYTFIRFNILELVIQVMFPLAFLGLLAFFLSTVFKSGNATAAVIIILGVVLLILTDSLEHSYWNIFFNPYDSPSGTSDLAWQASINKNRTFLAVGAVVFLLGGLMNLQKREKFLG